MTWSLKRQFFYIVILVLFFLGIGFLIIYPHINELPSCNDGKQNGDESGIDCGGSCSRACSFSVDQISILWVRTFEVIPGRYNAVAYFQNHNRDLAVQRIKYRFRFADKDNIYIGKREGETFIPPSGKFAIFEAGIGVGNSIPVYATFEFTEMPVWNKVSEEKLNELKLSVSNIELKEQDTKPYLSATIKNDSIFIVPEISVVAILYDENGNAVSASQTYLEMLISEEIKDISFTWPKPISENIVAKEIIPMYNIFLAKLK